MTLYQQGYMDALEGKPPQQRRKEYLTGYQTAGGTISEMPRKDAWGMDYKNVRVQGFNGWMITLTRLSDGRLLACWHCADRPKIKEVRRVLAVALLHNEWPAVLWVDEWLAQFASAEADKYAIRTHVRMYRQEGLECDGDEYAERLDKAIGRSPKPPTPPTSAMQELRGKLTAPPRVERLRWHAMN